MLVDVHAGGAGGCGAMQYSAIIRQSSRFSGVRLGGSCFIMAHYVVIAWGLNCWRVFLFSWVGAALWVLLFTLKINSFQKAKDNVLLVGRVQKA